MEKPADKNKPKKEKRYITKEKVGILIIATFIVTQLLGFVILPFQNQKIHIIGFAITLLGFIECMVARYNLSDNWANSYEYQIKEKHELITKGIYKYVRHPIYGGMFLMGIGMLLTAGSLTVIIYIPFVWFAINKIAQREEQLLIKHFGKEYATYMKNSKKIIPLII
jgi:protein-S-isoprenylcysteine O-methyltransferase Ste14